MRSLLLPRGRHWTGQKSNQMGSRSAFVVDADTKETTRSTGQSDMNGTVWITA